MDHKEKIRRWLVYAENNKIGKGYHRPPLDLLFQKLGWEVAPIVFWPAWRVILFMGFYFALVWGLLMYTIVWRGQGMPVERAVLLSIGTGLCFGFFMAFNYARARKKYQLPNWDQFSTR